MFARLMDLPDHPFFAGGFAHVYLVETAQPVALPAAAGAPPGAERTYVLKRMAVPDKEALAFVRGEVDIHVSVGGCVLISVILLPLTLLDRP